jgi:hypothetical protein
MWHMLSSAVLGAWQLGGRRESMQLSVYGSLYRMASFLSRSGVCVEVAGQVNAQRWSFLGGPAMHAGRMPV